MYGFVGASYGLPSGIPVVTNAHVGGILSLPDMRPSVGLFAEVPAPAVQKAVVGIELTDGPLGGHKLPQAALVGAEFTLDAENSIIAKACDNGIALISFIKHFKGIDLRMGVEADLV